MIHSLLANIDAEQEPQSLDFDSPYLEQLRTLTDQGDYAGIATLCEELAETGIYDIRLLLAGLYAEVQTDPLASLPSTLETLLSLFGEVWEQIGPPDKKAKYAKGSLAWLLKQIRIDLETQQVDQTPLWSQWTSGSLVREDLPELIALVDQFKRLVSQVIEDESQPSTQALNELSSWLTGDLMPALPSGIVEEEPESEGVEDNSKANQTSAGASSNGGRSVQGSYHLDLLIQKMELFRTLVEQGDTLKAAIIAADVNATLEQFDAKKYFPQIFSEFLYVMVNQANRIAEAMEMRDSPQWQVLQELYQIDMEKFHNIEVEY